MLKNKFLFLHALHAHAGFKKGYGTQKCTTKLATDILETFSQKSTCLAVFFNISSA